MTSIHVDLGQLPGFFRRAKDPKAVQAGLKAGAIYLVGKVKVYPGVRRRRVAHTWGPKQRRGFFAKLKSGDIQVPYRRGRSPGSERMAQRWSTKVETNRAVIGNNASYAPLVLSKKLQSSYHKGNWTPVEDVAEKEGPEVRKIVRTAIVGYWKGK